MSITDNKILSADLVGKKLSDRPDDFNGDPDVSKAWWDAPTDVITEKFNALIDSLDSVGGIVTVPSTIASATSNKGSYAGTVAVGSLVWVRFANGNTASSPTITIGGDSLTFLGIPTTAKISASTHQTYLFVRSVNSLVFLTTPNYICEYGYVEGYFFYERKANGTAKIFGRKSVTMGAGTAYVAGLYSQSGTFTFPTDLFLTLSTVHATCSGGGTNQIGGHGTIVDVNTGGVRLITNTATSLGAVLISITAEGVWK